MPIRRIERAYCIELGRTVSIDEARTTFLTREDFSAYHFECAELACRGLAVRIAGVNYRFDATAQPKLVSNHFRRLDDHHRDCPYYAPPDARDPPIVATGGRRARALRQDLVEEFIPPSTTRSSDQTRLAASPPREERPPKTRRRRRRDRYASTSSLSRLVDTYRALVASEVPNALRQHVIQVRGDGRLSICDYVIPMYRARQSTDVRVYYGGARWVKAYGAGFKLRFFDRVAGAVVFLYVSPLVASASAAWDEALAILRDGKYCTVYALGRLTPAPDDINWTIDIVDPSHLVFRQRAALEQVSA